MKIIIFLNFDWPRNLVSQSFAHLQKAFNENDMSITRRYALQDNSAVHEYMRVSSLPKHVSSSCMAVLRVGTKI